MSWLTAFMIVNLIGIGSNLDNTGVGIAYGIEQIRFPHWVNTIVNVIGFLTALLGAYAGTVIAHYIPQRTAELCSLVVLCTIGLFILYSAYVQPKLSKTGQAIRLQKPGLRQGILLGFALSFTNVASGFGATVSDSSSMWIAAISIGVWGYLLIWIGNIVGVGVVARFLGKYSSLVAGLLLILVGIHQLF